VLGIHMDVKQSAELFWISVEHDELIEAIKLLSPSGLTKKRRRAELQISLDRNEMTLCIPGAMSKCTAQGEWPGLLSVPYIFLYSIALVPLMLNTVVLRLHAERLRIDRLSISGIWRDAGALSSSMALGAHLDSEIYTSPKRYCPLCGKHKGIALVDFALPTKPLTQDWALYRLEEHREVTHGCKACGHGWRELALETAAE